MISSSISFSNSIGLIDSFLDYMECNFSTRQNISSLEMKVGDHAILQVTQFKYLGSTESNTEKVKVLNSRIQGVVDIEESLKCFM